MPHGAEKHRPATGFAGAALAAGVCRLASTGLSFILLAALARALGPVEYGHFVFLLSVGSALGLISPLGQHVLVLKHYRVEGARTDNRLLLHTNYSWMLRGVLLLLAAGAIAVMLGDLRHVYPAFIFAAFFAVTEYFLNYFRLQGRIFLALVPRENAWRGLALAAILAVVSIEPSLTGQAAFLIATALLGLIVVPQLVVFLSKEGASWLHGPGANSPDRRWRKESCFFFGGSVLDASAGYLDTIVIGTFVGVTEAAIYFTALRISKLLEIPKLILGTVGVPRIALACRQGDMRSAQRLLRQMVLASFVPTLAIAVIIYWHRHTVLEFFDPAFASHANALSILVLAALIHVAFGAGEQTMKIGGGEKQQLVRYGGLLAGHLVLLAVLGSTYGILGVATASLLHVTARGVVTSYWCQATLAVDPAITNAVRQS